jgi:hypothetical protein
MKTLRLALGALSLLGCSSQAPPTASRDIASLREVVDLNIPITSAKWEIFYHPEQTGGSMDNVESTILVAEIEPADRMWHAARNTPLKYKWLNPNDARPWISPELRIMLTGDTIDEKKHNCTYYQTTGVTSRNQVSGFACLTNQKVLLYLVLSSDN